MRIDNTPPLNWCLGNPLSLCLYHSKTRSTPPWKRGWEHDMELGRSSGSPRAGKKPHGRTAKVNICSIQEGWPSLVRLKKPEDHLSQKDETKTRRSLCDYQSNGPGNLQGPTSGILANTRCLPCSPSPMIQGKWDIWRELYGTTPRASGRRRSLWGRVYPKSLKMWTRLSILWQVAGLSYSRCLMGIAFEGPVLWTGKRPKPDQTKPIRTRPNRLQFATFEKKNRFEPHATGPVRTSCNRFMVPLKNTHILSLFWRETSQYCMSYGQNDMFWRIPTFDDIL